MNVTGARRVASKRSDSFTIASGAPFEPEILESRKRERVNALDSFLGCVSNGRFGRIVSFRRDSSSATRAENMTCLPDSLYNGATALKQQDKTTPFLSIDESRSTLKFNDSKANILEALNFLKGKNFNLKTLKECNMNPLTVL